MATLRPEGVSVLPLTLEFRNQKTDITGRDVVVIGRDATCDFQVDHHLVSRHHGRLERSDDGWTYTDTSSNGTYLNGQPVRQIAINPGTTQLEMPRGGAVVEIVLGQATVAGSPVHAPPAAAAAPPPSDHSTFGNLTRTIPFAGREVVRIGRASDNDLVLDDLSVSRYHAELRRGMAGLELVDLGSHNGTYVRGQRITRTMVMDGDIVGVGGATLRVRGDQLEEYDQHGSSWLWARDIVAKRGKSEILKGVSLAFEPASLVAIVGPTGAGKTTLMDALTGMVPANEGTVAFGGRTLAGSRDEWKLHLGYVPQDDLVHSQLTVRQAVDYAARLRFPPDVARAARQERVGQVLTELGIEHRANLPVSQLSGGQRKRTSIALELLTRPSLLFLDEPTSGLDPGKEEQVMELLRALADDGRIVIATTHSLGSLQNCDRVLFLARGGRPAYFGPPSEAADYFRDQGWGDTFPRIFRLLDDDGQSLPWAETFDRHPDHQRYIDEPLATAQGSGDLMETQASDGSRPRPSVSRQTWILIRRYVSIITSERKGLAMLLLQAPILAGLFLLMNPENVMTADQTEAGMLLWMLVIAVTWLGTSNAVREIVKERPITRRESNVGLSMTAYYLSKSLVLGCITILQVVVLAVLALIPQEFPVAKGPGGPWLDPDGGGAVVSSQFNEIVFALVLAGLAAMAVGLLASALMRSSDQAMLLLPLLLVAHVVVSAPNEEPPPVPLNYAAWASSASWGTAAVASTVDLNCLRSGPDADCDPAGTEALPDGQQQRASWETWKHEPGTWLLNVGMLLLITAAASGATWMVLRRGASGKPVLDRQA